HRARLLAGLPHPDQDPDRAAPAGQRPLLRRRPEPGTHPLPHPGAGHHHERQTPGTGRHRGPQGRGGAPARRGGRLGDVAGHDHAAPPARDHTGGRGRGFEAPARRLLPRGLRDQTGLAKPVRPNGKAGPGATGEQNEAGPAVTGKTGRRPDAAGPAGAGQDEGTVLCADGLRRPAWAATDELLRSYYDTEWGMPVTDERGLFERLSLEAFQSGLSWATILRKRPAFREAFAGFDPDAVAAFDAADVERLMSDARIVRNRRKIEATIANAQATVALRAEGGLADLIWSYRPATTPRPRTVAEVPTTSPESVALAKDLKARGFRHVGPTTMFALMEAVGIVDTHLLD